MPKYLENMERELIYVPEEVKVKPTPVQRNVLDVATELTLLYYEKNSFSSVDQIQETFVSFYAAVRAAEFSGSKDLIDFLSDNIKKIAVK